MSRCNLFFIDTKIDINKFRLEYIYNKNDEINMYEEMKNKSNDLLIDDIKTIPYFSHSLYYYLNDIKKEINKVIIHWDKYKKITNIYEYIHTNMPGTKKSICTLKPISRSFFKLIEMIDLFFMKEYFDTIPQMKSFHLAEGPGGFMEALIYKRKNPNDTNIGMTLIDDNKNIPGWKKSKICSNESIQLEYGIDGTGNIFHKLNYDNMVKKYKNSIHFITADGGFDFTMDFNNQELIATKLILYEVMYAISLQKKDGIFILKMYDIFTRVMLEILYILSSMYENVQICKPHTSRIANSEKYLYCRGFLLEDSSEYITIFEKLMNEMDEKMNNSNSLMSNCYIYSILNHDIEASFLRKLQEINSVLGNIQLENISNTLQLIHQGKENLDYYVKYNIQQCLRWCKKHNMPHIELDIDA